MYLKQIDGTIIDLSTVVSFRAHYGNPAAYAPVIMDQLNGGHFSGIVPGDVALDIGANVGLFSTYLAPYFKKIIAVEPFPGHFKILEDIVNQKGLTNIIPVNGALYDRDMDVSMHIHSGNTTMNNLVCPFGIEKKVVRAFTLESLLNTFGIDSVDLMKMDVEGSEMKIIPDDNFYRCREKIRRLTIEVHDFIMGGRLLGQNTDYIEMLLKSFGFSTIRQGTDSIFAVRSDKE